MLEIFTAMGMPGGTVSTADTPRRFLEAIFRWDDTRILRRRPVNIGIAVGFPSRLKDLIEELLGIVLAECTGMAARATGTRTPGSRTQGDKQEHRLRQHLEV